MACCMISRLRRPIACAASSATLLASVNASRLRRCHQRLHIGHEWQLHSREHVGQIDVERETAAAGLAGHHCLPDYVDAIHGIGKQATAGTWPQQRAGRVSALNSGQAAAPRLTVS